MPLWLYLLCDLIDPLVSDFSDLLSESPSLKQLPDHVPRPWGTITFRLFLSFLSSVSRPCAKNPVAVRIPYFRTGYFDFLAAQTFKGRSHVFVSQC